MEIRDIIASLKAGHALDAASVETAAGLLLEPGGDAAAKTELLRALSAKGETAGEIAGFVRAFLRHAVRPPLDMAALGRPVMDVCGTGGDKLDLFNISTAGMFILAAGGVAVLASMDWVSRCGACGGGVWRGGWITMPAPAPAAGRPGGPASRPGSRHAESGAPVMSRCPDRHR